MTEMPLPSNSNAMIKNLLSDKIIPTYQTSSLSNILGRVLHNYRQNIHTTANFFQ